MCLSDPEAKKERTVSFAHLLSSLHFTINDSNDVIVYNIMTLSLFSLFFDSIIIPC